MKKIAYTVIGMHCALLLWMAIWKPIPQKEKKPLNVRTVVVKAPEPKPAPPAPRPTPPTPPAPKTKRVAPVKRKAPPPPPPKKRAPTVPQNLVNDLRKSLDKIDAKPQKVLTNRALKAPERIATLKVDEVASEDASRYVTELVECLQTTLQLPDKGSVRLKLTLSNEGKFLGIEILESESDQNRKFLQNELGRIHYPTFSGSLKTEREHAFVLSFTNS